MIAAMLFPAGRFAPALRHRPRILRAARAVAAELIEAMAQIGIVAAEAALGKHGGDFRGELTGTFRRRIDHHARQPRRQRQRAQAAALVGDAALRIDGAELGEQGARLAERSAPAADRGSKRCGIARAPLRQIEHEGRQVGRENFRPRIRLERAGLRLVPQPIADAGLGAAGAAAALVGGGARNAHRLQPRQTDVRLVARHARQAAVDHHAHAFDGQRGLGNGGRQHDLAAAGRRRRNGAVLLARIERAIERDDVDVRIVDALLEQRFGAADLAGARQEHQQRALFGAQARAARRRRLAARSARGPRGRDSASRPESCGPWLSITGASPSKAATRAPSSVADITSSFKSSRRPCCTSRASARPRSASKDRSWNSSNSTAATPSSEGSSSTSRVNTPSVMTSMRVRLEILEPKRTRKPTVSPTCSFSVAAMRAAAARAASRRGSSTRIFLSAAHGSSSSTSGTRVVLPAPGGATSTAALCAASAAVSSRQRGVDGEGCVEDAHYFRRRHHIQPSSPANAGDPVNPGRNYIAMSVITGSPAFAGDDNF